MSCAKGGVCLVSLSDNYDHQTAVYSMFSELEDNERVYTVGLTEPKANAPLGSRNLYFDAPRRPGIAKGTLNLSNAKKLYKAILSTECETVYFESVHLWNVYLAWMLRGKRRVVITLHDVIPHGDVRGVAAVQKMLCSLADLVVIKSNTFKQDAMEFYKLSESKILVLPIWHHFPEYCKPLHTGEALFFGRVKRYKGAAMLPDIISACPNVHFNIVGMIDDDVRDSIEELRGLPNVNVNDSKVSPAVMDECFRRADWVILPYASASQSGVVVDSYERSRPVIAFAVGALGEQVNDGSTGFLVNAGDVAGFSSCINHCFQLSDDRLEDFCKRAYAFGYERYSSQEASARFSELFVDGGAWV